MIPHEWKKTVLRQLVKGELKNGYSPNPPARFEGYWVLSLSALTGEQLDIAKVKPAPHNKRVLSSLLKRDDYLISRSNTKDKVGRTARFKYDNANISYPDLMMKFKANINKVDVNFLDFVLTSEGARSYFQMNATGSSVTMVKINKKIVENLPILLPPLFEQKKIASVISAWYNAIHCTQSFLENKKKQKKALMQQLLTGRWRLPGFSNPWSAAPLNTLFREIKRPVIWDDNKEYKLLSVKRRAGGVFFRENIFGKEIKTKKLNSVCSDELLISKMQVVHGAIGIVPKDFDGCFVSDSYIILAPKNKNKLLMKFIGYYFQQPHIWHLAYLNSYGVHIEKMTFNFDSFLKETIEIPSDIAEQKAIADVLTAADAVIQQYEAKLANLQAQKKALMQQLLTGKIRVRTDTDAAQHQPA